jgi:hypothetical protein
MNIGRVPQRRAGETAVPSVMKSQPVERGFLFTAMGSVLSAPLSETLAQSLCDLSCFLVFFFVTVRVIVRIRVKREVIVVPHIQSERETAKNYIHFVICKSHNVFVRVFMLPHSTHTLSLLLRSAMGTNPSTSEF